MTLYALPQTFTTLLKHTMDKLTLNNGGSNPGVDGFRGNTLQQLPVVDWLADLPETQLDTDLVEVQFKNTRKGYFVNSNHIDICKGDMIAVEANPGHDIGVVTLMGRLVLSQLKKNHINMERYEIRRVYRKVKPVDVEKYEEAKALEHGTMIRARQIANDLHLDMKIGDVEFQGDGSKAIFYYIADERVDFRQLIKVLAEEFRVRIEMKQIGARQEAGRIGGIGPCGRELCCTTWMSNFVSVSTNAARAQDLGSNPLKLAGQCAKIKCCVNFEAAMYVDIQKDFPSKDTTLETLDGTYYLFKADTFRRQLTYSSSPHTLSNLTTISVERANEIIRLNRKGVKIDRLEAETTKPVEAAPIEYQNVVGQDSLTRFDKSKVERGRRGRRQRDEGRETTANNGEPQESRETQERKLQREEGEKRGNRENGQRKNGRATRPQREDRPQREERSERKERTERREGPDNKQRRSQPQQEQQRGDENQ